MANKDQTDEMWAGNRHIQEFPIKDENGTDALDVSGLKVNWALTALDPDSGEYDTAALLEKSTDLGEGITFKTDGTDGIVLVTFEEADTLTLAASGAGVEYHFELEVFDGTPEGVVSATGTLTLFSNVVNTI